MSSPLKELLAASGSKGGVPIEEIFNVYVYQGNGIVYDCVTGLDLVNNKGLVWIKLRSAVGWHILTDTLREATNFIRTDYADIEVHDASTLTSFNSNGFSLGNSPQVNTNGQSHVAYTFMPSPKFFSIVEYIGDGIPGKTIPHTLGIEPGMIQVKRLDVEVSEWAIYHKSLGATQQLTYENPAAITSSVWNGTEPTNKEFTIGDSAAVNNVGERYIAYLFADSEEPDSNIACGNLSVDGTGIASVELGWEPQYLLIKASSEIGDWSLFDSMRGINFNRTDAFLAPNNNLAEDSAHNFVDTYHSGFSVRDFGANRDLIYMAIRKSTYPAPKNSSEVFAIDTQGGSGDGKSPGFRSGFIVDMILQRRVNSIAYTDIAQRLTQGYKLRTGLNNGEFADTNDKFDYVNGFGLDHSIDTADYAWMFKRAYAFFDVVNYVGDNIAGREIPHNLGAKPDMMWIKSREANLNWVVYLNTPAMGATKAINLDNIGAAFSTPLAWDDTEPTDTVFTIGNWDRLNSIGHSMAVYLFATLSGISKVGQYTGNGTSQIIDCDFLVGSKFIIIRTLEIGSWWYVDSARGFDKVLQLDGGDIEITVTAIGTDNSGFTVTEEGTLSINTDGVEYAFYAVAT